MSGHRVVRAINLTKISVARLNLEVRLVEYS